HGTVDMAMGNDSGGMGPDLAMPSHGGHGDMAARMPPDLLGLPAPDHDPKQHPPLPTMGGTYATNSPFTAPVIYNVVWSGATQTNGKDTGAAVQAFVNDMLQSDYWYNAVKEYGAGKGHAAPKVITLSDPPPTMISDGDLQKLIMTNLGNTTAGWPK